jgi:hypothetical protein
MAASVATEYLLGEYNFHYWVGGIDVEAERSGPGWLPLERFKTTFDALVSSMQDQLPSTPLHTVADSLKWFTYERDGADDRDPAGVSDIFVGSTCMRKALPAVFGRVPFVSDRFSRCGEEFGYLKIDFVDVERGDFIDKRTKLQDSFEPMLKETGAGSIWGGGAGRRYAYIFLALTDVQKAVEIIVDGLQQHDTPERSWLLFLDVRLRNEWIGLAPNTPPPPGFGAES